MKYCNKCDQWKNLSEFHRRKSAEDGLQYMCRTCQKQYNKRWHNENREYHNQCRKRWREDNIEHCLQYDKQYWQQNKNYYRKYRKQYRRTLKGRIDEMWRNMKESQYRRDIPLNITKDEFLEICDQNRGTLEALMEQWKANNYVRAYTPSVDRIDNTKGYELGNIQFITNGDNAKKARTIDRKRK